MATKEGRKAMISRSILEKFEIAAAAFLVAVQPASAEAKPVSIEGNAWVAILILLVLVAVIYFLVIGPLKIEERDARLRRNDGGAEHGWFGSPGHRHDDDDGDDSNGNGSNN